MRGYGPQAADWHGAKSMTLSGRPAFAAHVSHYHGPADLLLPLIDEGRALGFDLTFDTYPYLAGSTILGMVALPSWVQEGGIDATVKRLRRPGQVRARLNSEWFSVPTPYPLDTESRSRWSRIPIGSGRREYTVSVAAEHAKLAARRLRLRDPDGLGHGGGNRWLPFGRED